MKQLARVFLKSRKIRSSVRRHTRKNVPRSSQIHVFTSRIRTFHKNYVNKGKVRKQATVKKKFHWFKRHRRKQRMTNTQRG